MPARFIPGALITAILLAVLVGCGEDPCPSGTRAYGSSCVSSNVLGDGGSADNDGGMDSGTGDGDLGNGDSGRDGGDGDGNGDLDADVDAQVSPCGTPCTGSAAICDPDSKECVECLSGQTDACALASGKPFCLEGGNVCVGCNSHDDCPTESESRCDESTHQCAECNDDSQCSDVEGKPVCLDGACVACTREKAQTCNVGGVQYVCDPATHACDLKRKARSKTLCNICLDQENKDCTDRPECVSNDKCQPGQLCVNVAAGAGLRVCQQALSDEEACPRPFVSTTTTPVPSADGESAIVCTLRQTNTTCQAHAHYSNKRCGTAKVDKPNEDEADSGDNSECGAPGLTDGYCVFSAGLKQYRCTVPCGNDVVDCPDGSSSCITAPSPDLCAL